MKQYIQHTEDGTITGTVMSTGNIEHPSQLVIDAPDGKMTNTDGMRVDLKTKKLVPCPRIAKERHNGHIQYQLKKIDDATPRAVRDFYLTGNKTALQNLEDQAALLRPKLQK